MFVVESQLKAVDELALLYLACARDFSINTIMGHSLGGLIAIRMGLVDPNVAKHVIATSPLLGLNISPLTSLAHSIMSTHKAQEPYILDYLKQGK